MKKHFSIEIIIFLLVLISFLIMFLGGKTFIIVSIVFYGLGGLFEWIIMKKFLRYDGRPKKKRKFMEMVDEGTIWVNHIIWFLVFKRSTIYDYKRFGYIPAISSYGLMLLYVLSAYLFYPIISYYAFLFYLIPVVTNTVSFIVYFIKIRKYKR